MKIVFIILLSFCHGFLLAQHQNQQSIEFRKIIGFSKEAYSIALVKSKYVIKVSYQLVDSVSEELYKDNNYREYMDKGDDFLKQEKTIDTQVLQGWADNLERIIKSYTIYKLNDSLIFNVKALPKLNRLFVQMLNTPTPIIENNVKGQLRIVLDGYKMRLSINNNGKRRTIYTRSPTLESHPLIIELLNEVLELYRKNKGHTF